MLAPFHNPNLGAFAPPYSCNESGRARDPPEPPLRLFSCFCGVRGFLSSPLALSVFASLREIILSFSPTIRETQISRFPLREEYIGSIFSGSLREKIFFSNPTTPARNAYAFRHGRALCAMGSFVANLIYPKVGEASLLARFHYHLPNGKHFIPLL